MFELGIERWVDIQWIKKQISDRELSMSRKKMARLGNSKRWVYLEEVKRGAVHRRWG